MARRTITALLWLLAVWTFWNGLSVYAGLPWLVGPLAGFALAGLIWWDPREILWRPRPDRAAVRRRLADLERLPAPEPARDVRREAESARG
ncbi:MAG TPA: hypothetical protein VJ506_05175 [Candidatus Limnocylindrales bacterium]|nr:hypothetical protein [Candidatus Limnocylindrales bacterium]